MKTFTGLLDKLSTLSQLIKFRVSLFVALTSGCGYLTNGGLISAEFFLVMLFAFISSSGAAVANEALEVREDSIMRRTRERPICTGKVSKEVALLTAGVLTVTSSLGFLLKFNPHVAFLSILTFLLYNFIYTPLKKITIFAVLIGTIPGALPVLGGALATGNTISLQATTFFCVLIFWQVLHFAGLGALYSSDYEAAGFKIGLNERTKKFYLILTTLCSMGFIFCNLYLIYLKPNFFSFFVIFITQVSSAISVFFLLKNLNQESSVLAVKNLSFTLLCLIIVIFLR